MKTTLYTFAIALVVTACGSDEADVQSQARDSATASIAGAAGQLLQAVGGEAATTVASTGGSTTITSTGGSSNVKATGGTTSTGGTPATGGTTQIAATGGTQATGGALGAGGSPATGGALSTGGTPASGGKTSTGGRPDGVGGAATGGKAATGGAPATGSSATGGLPASGGAATGGVQATGGAATGGSPATGGVSATGGSSGVVVQYEVQTTGNDSVYAHCARASDVVVDAWCYGKCAGDWVNYNPETGAYSDAAATTYNALWCRQLGEECTAWILCEGTI